MAKFLKSIFTPTDKKKGSKYEVDEEERNDFTPPLDGRRKLSISRSGRMKQANKKRNSLSLDIYGENFQAIEKPKTIEYHVNKVSDNLSRSSIDNKTKVHENNDKVKENNDKVQENNEKEQENNDKVQENNDKVQEINEVCIEKGKELSPEEQIENAFEIIDKVS